MANQIRQSNYNNGVVVGSVSEFNLTLKENYKVINKDTPDEAKIKSAIMYGKIVVSVNGDTVETSVMVNKHTGKGSENAKFKGLLTLMGKEYTKEGDSLVLKDGQQSMLKPEVSGAFGYLVRDAKQGEKAKVQKVEGVGSNADRITVDVTLGNNESLKDNEIILYPKIVADTISRSKAGVEDKTEFKVEGVIKEIRNELDGNAVATGRLVIDFLTFGFFGMTPLTFVLEKELVEPFMSTGEDGMNYKKGVTCTLSGEFITKTFGKPQAKSSGKTFGKQVEIKSGFSKLEWVIVGGEQALKDTDANKYNVNDVAVAINEYDVYLDNRQKQLLAEQARKAKESQNGSNSSGISWGTGNSLPPSKTIEEDDMLPF